jgi:hypothetical protein
MKKVAVGGKIFRYCQKLGVAKKFLADHIDFEDL